MPSGRLTAFPRRGALAAAATALALVAAACGTTGQQANGGHRASGAATSHVLTFASGPTATVTGNQNPFSPSSDLNSFGVTDWIYEPLLQWDLVKSGTPIPWLARSYRWSNGGKTLTFILRKGVSWSDGHPFTSADVVFTFDLLRRDPALNTNGITFSSISAPSPSTVVMHFATPQYVRLYFLGGQFIVPRHLWDRVAKPVNYLDKHPVGTGPYLLSSASSQHLTMVRNRHYWMPGKPAVAQIDLPTYVSNTPGDLALADGRADWGDLFFAGIKRAYLAKDPKYRHDWFPGFQNFFLMPNLARYPLNQLPLRQAISLALNRSAILKQGEQNEYAPDTTPTGLLLPQQSAYLAPRYAHLHFAQDVHKANSILQAAGYRMGPHGIRLDPKGHPLSFSLEAPSAYTDSMADSSIIATELKAIGIDIAVRGVAVSTWTSDLADGTYQLSYLFGSVGPGPYYDYFPLDTAFYKPVGKSTSIDQERWRNPVTTRLLTRFASTNDPAVQHQAINALETIMVKDLPLIPLMYNAVQQEWTDRNFVGWPSPKNPYSWGAYSPENELVVVHLRPRR